MGFSVNDIRYASHDVAIADATNITGGPCRIYGMGTGIRFDTNLSIASTGTPDALWVAYKAE
jgi:hypothetical protein